MPEPVLAEVYLYLNPYCLAKAQASSKATLRSAPRSALFPTTTTSRSGENSTCLETSSMVQAMRLRLLASVRSKTRRMHPAPLQQLAAMDLNRSCPAVSQICSLTTLPAASTVFILKSTPMVGSISFSNWLSAYRLRSADLPTEEGPATTTLWMKSQSCILTSVNSVLLRQTKPNYRVIPNGQLVQGGKCNSPFLMILPKAEDIYDLDIDELQELLARIEREAPSLVGDTAARAQQLLPMLQLEIKQRNAVFDFGDQLSRYGEGKHNFVQDLRLFNLQFFRLAQETLVKGEETKPVQVRSAEKPRSSIIPSLPPLPPQYRDTLSTKSKRDSPPSQKEYSEASSSVGSESAPKPIFGQYKNRKTQKNALFQFMNEALARTRVQNQHRVVTVSSAKQQESKRPENKQKREEPPARKIHPKQKLEEIQMRADFLKQTAARPSEGMSAQQYNKIKASSDSGKPPKKKTTKKISSEKKEEQNYDRKKDSARAQKKGMQQKETISRKSSREGKPPRQCISAKNQIAAIKQQKLQSSRQVEKNNLINENKPNQVSLQFNNQITYREYGTQMAIEPRTNFQLTTMVKQKAAQRTKRQISAVSSKQVFKQEAGISSIQKQQIQLNNAVQIINISKQKEQVLNNYQRTAIGTAEVTACAFAGVTAGVTAEQQIKIRSTEHQYLDDQQEGNQNQSVQQQQRISSKQIIQLVNNIGLNIGQVSPQQTKQYDRPKSIQTKQAQNQLQQDSINQRDGAINQQKQKPDNQQTQLKTKQLNNAIQPQVEQKQMKSESKSHWNSAIERVRRQISSFREQLEQDNQSLKQFRLVQTIQQNAVKQQPSEPRNKAKDKQSEKQNHRETKSSVKPLLEAIPQTHEQEQRDKVPKKPKQKRKPLPPPKQLYPPAPDYKDLFPSFDSFLTGYYLKTGSAFQTERESMMRQILTIFTSHNAYFESNPYLPKPIPTFELKETHYYSDPARLLACAQQTFVPLQAIIQKQKSFSDNVFGTKLELSATERYYRVVKNREQVYDIVTTSFMRLQNWSQLPKGCNLKTSWNLLWTWSKPEIDLAKLVAVQRVNHFPYNKNLVRKDLLFRNVDLFKKLVRNVNLNILPVTFALPRDFSALSARFHEDELAEGPELNLWIMKPIGKSRGRGIKLVNSIAEMTTTQNVVVQKYLKNPLLIDGYKFDMRIYVLVTSVHPLEAFVYKEGFARLSTEKFSLGLRDLKNNFIHLTNFAINKHNLDSRNSTGGCKISFRVLRDKLGAMGINFEDIWAKSVDIIVKSLLCCVPSFPRVPNSFELFGYDIIVDQDLNCLLLEVNSSPSLERSFVLDEVIKQNLIDDIFELLDPSPLDRVELASVLSQRLAGFRGKEDDNLDIARALRFRPVRRVGELPPRLGLFERIAPQKLSLQLEPYFMAGFKQAAKLGFKQID